MVVVVIRRERRVRNPSGELVCFTNLVDHSAEGDVYGGEAENYVHSGGRVVSMETGVEDRSED